MTAGLRSQRAVGATVALPPTAIAGLLSAALLIGGLLGVVTKSELDAMTAHQVAAVAASTGASGLLIDRNTRIAERASREVAAPVAAATGVSQLLIERNTRIAERASGV